ncbi:MAG: hypothetical protein OEZ00_02040 [Dehalococcoidia bacterium]|nr:hypothetical protein [Dehalococcoidia bacterium]
MQTEPAGKLRLNLARWDCLSFRITTEVTLEEDVAESLGIVLKRRFARFYEQYTRGGVLHSMALRFVRYQEPRNRYGIRLLYETEQTQEFMPSLIIKPTTPKPSEVFLRVCNLETSLVFRCDCSFIYKREGEGVYFPLPIKLEDELFDEIRGVRLVKLQQDKILLENFIDLVEPDVMIHRIKFAHEGKCSVDLPQRLLRRAKTISRNT